MNKNPKMNNYIKEKEKERKKINEEEFFANFNFGEVNEDDQLIQAIIEQSLKEQKKKK